MKRRFTSHLRIDMRISIALCTYNGSKYLREQLDSLFNQTVKPYEIIVSDDVSTDETITILKEYRDRDSDIKLTIVENSSKLGVFKNFPYVINKCSGDIIFTCDQDDFWMPSKLEKHMQMHELDETIDLVYSNADVVYNDIDHYLYPLWEVKSIQDKEKGQASFESLVIKGRSIAGCCMSFKKSFVEQIYPFPNDVYHDDWIATNACLAGKIHGISESLIKYRQHGNNAVGIVRGGKLSFIKSLFTNVPFYVKSDMYIYKRHQKVYDALKNSKHTMNFVEEYHLHDNLVFYQNRSCYGKLPLLKCVKLLVDNLMCGRYRYHHGIFTFMKDLYNLLFIKLFRINLDA